MDYHIYSDLPHETVELLHTYLIGAKNEKMDGYIPNWMDDDPAKDGHRVDSIRVPRKRGSRNPSCASSERSNSLNSQPQNDEDLPY